MSFGKRFTFPKRLPGLGWPGIFWRAILLVCVLLWVTSFPGALEQSTTLENLSCLLRSPQFASAGRNHVCGKLMFMQDLKTGAYLIGLLPCPGSGSEIMIFIDRPRELWLYYKILDPEITEGDEIITQYGILDTYIKTFREYLPLHNCTECTLAFTSTSAPVPFTPSPEGFIFPSPAVNTSTQTVIATWTPSPTQTEPQMPTFTTTVTYTTSPSLTFTSSSPVEPSPTPTKKTEESTGLCTSAPLVLFGLILLGMSRRLSSIQ